MVGMNRLSTPKRIQVVAALVEGNSLRSVTRLTGVHRTTVQNLLVNLGFACSAYQDETFVNLPSKRIECDEIWSFVGAKDKNAKPEQKEKSRWGDVWTWVALDADSKLVPTWHVGSRDATAACHFMHDLAGRLANRVQLTTDGHRAYLEAVPRAFGTNIDFARLVKIYGKDETEKQAGRVCIGSDKEKVIGQPAKERISTALVERQNLTMRMGMRRFTRLTNGFSKKIENHCHAISLHFMHYNFCRIHRTLKATPAMAAGVSEKAWSLENLVELL